MLPSMMTSQSFVRKRFDTVLVHGAPRTDPDSVASAVTFYGSIQPGSGTVDVVNRDGAEIVYTILGPPGQDVNHHDRVDYLGAEYFVNGAPEQWGTGILDHMVIRLSRWAE